MRPSMSEASPQRRRTVLVSVALASLLILSACDSQKSDFLAGCTGNGSSEASCTCMYDLAKDTLPENYFTVYAAQMSGDDQLSQREMAKLTIPQRLGFTARVVEVTAIAAGQCPAR
jgi:hypothetical protein